MRQRTSAVGDARRPPGNKHRESKEIKMITHNTDGQASVSEPVISEDTLRIFMGFLRKGGLTPEQLYAAAKSAGLTDLEYYQCNVRVAAKCLHRMGRGSGKILRDCLPLKSDGSN